MKLVDYLSPKRIFLHLTPDTKEGILRQLVEGVVLEGGVPKEWQERLYQSLLDREEVKSTGIGRGVAVPHAIIDELNCSFVCMGLCPEGTDFDAIDKKPVHVFIALVGPMRDRPLHLQLLASIARIMLQPCVLDEILAAQSEEEVYHILERREILASHKLPSRERRPMFRKILIANRGEIALRVVRTAKKLGVRTVVVCSEADRSAAYLHEADETVCVGEGPAAKSYLNIKAILQAAHQSECQAIHPGYGFLSENYRFSYLAKSQNLIFIGPPPEAVLQMGDKVQAKQLMARAGVPVLPGEQKKLESIEEALAMAERLGYPVLLKASAGGGGRGMRLVRSQEELAEQFSTASQEARQAFGDGSLYLEKYIQPAKHIEFQVLVDAYGQAIHLGERECSIQRRHQKLIEEAPSPALSEVERHQMGELVARALAQGGYQNAGTVEFLRDVEGNLYFMEVNARLQVEHPVTEMITNLDLVEEQLRIAAGFPLSLAQRDVHWEGHAIECRINAEDPERDFRPAPGKITRFTPPRAEWVRLDTHVCEGYQIPPYYDSMIAKLIVWGRDRREAIARMQEALEHFHVEGVPTTIPLLQKVLALEEFVEGTYHTRTLESMLEKQ